MALPKSPPTLITWMTLTPTFISVVFGSAAGGAIGSYLFWVHYHANPPLKQLKL